MTLRTGLPGGTGVPMKQKSEVRTLCKWIEHYGGISLPFRDLAGDSHQTAKGGFIRISGVFNMSVAIKSLVSEVRKGSDLRVTRLALRLAEQVLAFSADNTEALRVLADAYEGLEQWHRVIETTTRLMELDDQNKWTWAAALGQRGLARLELGDTEGARADIDTLLALRKPYGRRWAKRLEKALADHERKLVEIPRSPRGAPLRSAYDGV